MVFGLMMVFNGSIAAQSPRLGKDERPGTLAPNCVGKSPRVGDKIMVEPKTGSVTIARRDKPDGVNFGPWYAVCNLSIDIDPEYKKRAGEENYYATINYISPSFEVLQKGYIVKWQAIKDSDFFIFTTADGKREVGRVIAMLDKPNPKRVENK